MHIHNILLNFFILCLISSLSFQSPRFVQVPCSQLDHYLCHNTDNHNSRLYLAEISLMIVLLLMLILWLIQHVELLQLMVPMQVLKMVWDLIFLYIAQNSLQHASPFVLIIQKFHIMPQYGAILDSTVFRHRGRGTKNDGNVHGQRQLTNHITCSSDSLVNAFFQHTQSRTCQHVLSLQFSSFNSEQSQQQLQSGKFTTAKRKKIY